MANGLLKPEQQKEIEEKVNSILVQHATFNQWEILQQTARDCDIEIEQADLRDVSGVLYLTETKKWKILVNQSDSLPRKMFTIAHELGHYFLHKDKHTKFVDSQFSPICYNRAEATKYENFEVEANEFAGVLIMPKSVVDKEIAILKQELKTQKIDADFIAILANKFGVSPIAMLTRLKNLGYV